MNEQKDNQKNVTNSYGHQSVNNEKSLENKPSYEFASKKTEKLVTALYMITDCMDADDALKGKLRILGVELLSDMYKLPILSPVEKHSYTTTALSRIGEIMAFVEIAHTIGFVSEMNATILKKEFTLLVSELDSYKSQTEVASFKGVLFENQKNSSFTLSEKMFEVGNRFPQIAEVAQAQRDQNSIKDKRTPNSMSFTNSPIESPMSSSKGLRYRDHNSLGDRNERSHKIIALIKEKKEISIKDISGAFLDCSEKTIQRELNTLVLKGQIKKTGAKRWSRYSSM